MAPAPVLTVATSIAGYQQDESERETELQGGQAAGRRDPVVAYVDGWRQAHPEPVCTVVLPELVAHHWRALVLNNQRAFWLKAVLLSRATVAVADVTYHLED